jgi:antitoxin PrlF
LWFTFLNHRRGRSGNIVIGILIPRSGQPVRIERRRQRTADDPSKESPTRCAKAFSPGRLLWRSSATPLQELDSDETAWYYIYIKVMEITMESAITVKGQATIPKAIREHLRLKPGDRVKFFVHPDGSVVLLPKLPAAALRGMIKSRRRRPVTVGEMTEAAAEGAAGIAPRAGRR